MPIDLTTLETLARAATPGPWLENDDSECGRYAGPPGQSLTRADAAYIAAMSPDVALKLLAVVQAAKALADDNSDDPDLISAVGVAVSALDALTGRPK
jgi:hypothetical protein